MFVPFSPSTNLREHLGQSIYESEYSQTIVSLMYLTKCSRTDIAYVVYM